MISDRCQRAIDCIFPNADAAEARTLLASQCGHSLPLLGGNSTQIERVQLAALKLCCGSLTKLTSVVREARKDWRDVLLAAFPNADDSRVWDPATHPFPEQIVLPDGRVVGEFRGLVGSPARQRHFQLRLVGCPFVRERLFSTDWIASLNGELLAVLKVSAPQSLQDTPVVSGAAVIRLSQRMISTAFVVGGGQSLRLLDITAHSLRVSVASNESHIIELDLTALPWEPLY